MPRKTAKTSQKPQDPRKVAARVVQEWFDELCSSSDAFNDGTNAQTLQANLICEVQEAVKAADRDPLIGHDSDAVQDEIYAREAGFLVGVQLGLRLRAAGGAR